MRRHHGGLQAAVRVTGHKPVYRQYDISYINKLGEIQQWRKEETARLRAQRPKPTKGTFPGDVREYLSLPSVRMMPTFAERKRDIELWLPVIGSIPRSEIRIATIRAQRDVWHERGPKRVWRAWRADGSQKPGGRYVDVEAPLAPSTVNHRLRALAHFFTTLDGLRAPNPAREVPELDEDDGAERGFPYDVIEAIIAAMPDRGRAAKGATRPTVSETKIRARVIAYAGLEHIAIERLTLKMMNLEAGWIDRPKRKKGKGTKSRRVPLTEQGIAALKDFVAAGLIGKKFSRSSMCQSIYRACEKVARDAEQLGAHELAAALRKMRPYDLRHSYVSEVLEKSGGDFHATQLLSGHEHLSTTLRYGKRGVSPALASALAKVRAAGGFGAAPVAPTSRPEPQTAENTDQ